MKTKLFTLFLMLTIDVGAIFAEKVKIGDLYYNLDDTNQTAEVTSQNYYSPYWSTSISTADIPSSVTYNSKTYSVTSIGNHTFYNCYGLISVTIPNSVTSIGEQTFYGCSNLTSVTIPNSVISIGTAFSGCTGLTSPVYNAHVFAYMPNTYSGAYAIPNGIELIAGSAFSGCVDLTSVTIPNSVISIRQNAFSGCTGLTSVTIPNSVTSIGHSAFFGCTGLISATIGNSITNIEDYTFRGCTGLISIEIPNSVTNIEDYTFRGCTGLISIEIPNSVTNIGSVAFSGCSSLTSVTIGNSVTSIGYGTFSDCTGLTSVLIPNSVTNIGSVAFSGCSSLTSVTIGNSVTSIGSAAFSGCTGLTSPVYNAHMFAYMPTSYNGSYTIPDGIESIIGSACSRCSGLTSVTIPNSVTSIGGSAFDGCTGLTSVTIGNNVTSIERYTFRGCSGLTSVTIPNSVTSIRGSAFGGCTSLTSVTIGNNVTNIEEYAFNYGCISEIHFNGDIKEWIEKMWPTYRVSDNYMLYIGDELVDNLIIPNSVTSIGQYAISGCISLTSVTIPNSVTSIGDGAFSRCRGLTSVTIPNSVTSIGNLTFNNCYGLISVIIPNSVISIGQYAFSGCSSLTSVTIPNSVTSIGEGAFYDCRRLTSVWSEAITPPILGNEAFKNTKNCLIYVPCNTLDAYKTAWSTYSSQIEYGPLEYSITGVVNIEGAGSVQLPQKNCEDIIAIPNYGYHFSQWSDGNTDNPRMIELTQDTILTAIFAIDKSGICGKDSALNWSYEDKTKTLTITGNGALTENYTFGVEAPTQMQNLIIGNEVTSIGDSAFYSTQNINHLAIGGNVASIGDYAFSECKNFDDITCYAYVVPTITSTTFANVGNKRYIYLFVPEDRERAYKRDTYWGQFDIQIQKAETTTTDGDVTVVPTDNTVEITWPSVNNAETYEIVITKDGEVVCTLIFNANGQLTGIAFAPSRNNTQQTQTSGFRFTVTGLTSNTHYGYAITSKDAGETTIDTKSGSFTTTLDGQSTEGIEDVLSTEKATKILRDGQILILRGDKTYTLTGQEVK